MIDILDRYRQTTWESCGAAGLLTISNARNLHLPSEMEIHKNIYDSYSDGSSPEAIEKFCTEFGISCRLLKNQTIDNLRELLEKDFAVMLLIKDYYPDSFGSDPEGHYLIPDEIDKERLKVIDPSNALRPFNEKDEVLTHRNGRPLENKPTYYIRLDDLVWLDEVKPGVIGNGYALVFGGENRL